MALINWDKLPSHLVARCVALLACMSEVPQPRAELAVDTAESVERVSDVIRTLRLYRWNIFGNAADGWALYLTKAQKKWVCENYVEPV